MIQIIEFFRIIVSKYLIRDIQSVELMRIAADIFECYNYNLHTIAMPNFKRNELFEWDQKNY